MRSKYLVRSISLRVGDKVKVMRGKYKGKEGKVTKVSLKKGYVNIEGLVLKNKDGREIPIKFDPSNLLVVDLFLDDEKRFKNIRRPENGK